MSEIVIDATNLTHDITLKVRVRGLRTIGLRWLIAAHILRLAQAVAGMDMDVSVEEGAPSKAARRRQHP